MPVKPITSRLFLSTPSARRATPPAHWAGGSIAISIHALREEGDRLFYAQAPQKSISIHALREEGDQFCVDLIGSGMEFLSTPSARRATTFRSESASSFFISIHALREEGDALQNTITEIATIFLSTPSARRATKLKGTGCALKAISIHALREEGDPYR